MKAQFLKAGRFSAAYALPDGRVFLRQESDWGFPISRDRGKDVTARAARRGSRHLPRLRQAKGGGYVAEHLLPWHHRAAGPFWLVAHESVFAGSWRLVLVEMISLLNDDQIAGVAEALQDLERAALAYQRQFGRALHWDVKRDNLMVREDGTVVLNDVLW